MDSASSSPEQTRTADMVVNSHPLYRLSYRGKLILDEEYKFLRILSTESAQKTVIIF